MWILVLILIFLSILYYRRSRAKFSLLPAPGACLPFLGHYKVFTNGSDPANIIWDLYKKYSSNGIMHLNIVDLHNDFIGDFNALKEVFNDPNAQNRGHC